MAIHVQKLVCSHSVISDTHYERLQTPRAPNTMTGLVTKSSYQTSHAPHYEFWGVGCWFRRTACAQNSNVAHREGRQTHFASWPRCVCTQAHPQQQELGSVSPGTPLAGSPSPWRPDSLSCLKWSSLDQGQEVSWALQAEQPICPCLSSSPWSALGALPTSQRTSEWAKLGCARLPASAYPASNYSKSHIKPVTQLQPSDFFFF